MSNSKNSTLLSPPPSFKGEGFLGWKAFLCFLAIFLLCSCGYKRDLVKENEDLFGDKVNKDKIVISDPRQHY